MKIFVLLVLIMGASFIVHAQEGIDNHKLSPRIWQRKSFLHTQKEQIFWISTLNIDSLKKLFEQRKGISILNEYPGSRLLVIKAKWNILDSSLLASPLIRFADIPLHPTEELAVPSFDNGVNTINTAHCKFPAVNGNNTVVSIKENNFDTTDIDFKQRILTTSLYAPVFTTHASIMATIIGGGGNSFYTSKGAAWASTLTSSDFASILPDADAAYRQYNISIQNHSYGTGIENYYGADAAAYDASVINNPWLLHIFSAGNSGTVTDTTGTYTGVTNSANLTGSFKMAKNIITVGSVDSFYNIALLSSKGPAYDGRIKPELVAFGQDGSSGAAAITSGTSLLLQHAYRNLNNGQLPAAALVKAILINTADDLGVPGPDFQSGFGNVNAFKALQCIVNGNYYADTISNNDTKTFSLNIPVGIRKLKITLSWSDPPAAVNAAKALINDLDLQLINTATNEIWSPWVLNSFPHADSLSLPAERKRDSINNVEQISLNNPVAGSYDIRVNGYSIPNGSQPYHVAYQLDTADQFQWTFPTAKDNFVGNENNILRWSSTFNATIAKLEYSVTNGSSWQLLSDAIDLKKGYYSWHAPDTFCTALFRITINNLVFTSDTCTISSPLTVQVGFDCTDSALLFWNKAPPISNYQVYHLSDRYLEPRTTVSDSAYIIHKSGNPSLYYSVAPVLSGTKEGMRSYTVNYSTQGTGCYVRTFLADLINKNMARLTLELGTVYQVSVIEIEKKLPTGFSSWKTINVSASQQYTTTDTGLQKGANIYRAHIILKDGTSIYSDPAIVLYVGSGDYLVFPNPVKQGQLLQIYSDQADSRQLQIFNSTGQKVLEHNLNSLSESISLSYLKKGIYFLVIYKGGKKDYHTAIIVQ